MSDVSSSSQDNFDRSRTMMDNIGDHCTICNQLDFLPYTCQICHKSFCSNHRNFYNEHACVSSKSQQTGKVDVSKLAPSSSFFPDRTFKVKQEKPTSILSSLELRSGKEDNAAQLALQKLKLFLKRNKSLGKKKFTLSTSSTTSRIIEIANLKKTAIGDSKIPSSERIFINVQYIPSLEELTVTNNSKKDKQLAIYVSRSWPIGRLLDQASLHLKIKNENNKTQDVEKKLTIFRAPRFKEALTEPIYISASSRVMKEVQDGDLLYLVRGAAI